MSVRPTPCFEVVCDEPGCEKKTGDYGEYGGWGDQASALDDWRDVGGQTLEDGRTYCPDHEKPACTWCGRAANGDLVLDEPDGDLYCPDCIKKVTTP